MQGSAFELDSRCDLLTILLPPGLTWQFDLDPGDPFQERDKVSDNRWMAPDYVPPHALYERIEALPGEIIL
jgi:hypothetical protein